MIHTLLGTFLWLTNAADDHNCADVTLSNGFLIPMVVVLILVLLNGFFVAAEFAMLGARPSRMETLAEDGNQMAGRIQQLLESVKEQNSFLATAQLGITIVTLALSMYGEKSIAHWLECKFLWGNIPDGLVVITGTIIVLSALTYLHVVIGEMVPKAMALGNPNSVVMQLFRPMNILKKILILPIWILNGIGNLLLRAVGIPPEHEKARLYTSEEIEQIVSESSDEGLITDSAETLISNIFDFSEREVGQVMTPRRKVRAIPVDMPYDDMVKFLVESRHSRFPVYEDDLDHIIGVLHLKKFAKHYMHNGSPFNLRELLDEHIEVSRGMPIDVLLQSFKAEHYHIAVVMDEFGGVAGIVTLEDLVEEIVGEVHDEFDDEPKRFIAMKPGVIECEGNYLLEELQEKVYLGERELPDVDTVGGLIVTILGRPPAPGDAVQLDDVILKVTEVDGRAATRIQVTYPALEQERIEEVEAADTH